MAYIRGTQVRPELGAGNFGAILAGGQQKAASIQRGMESLGQGIAGGIQQYSATKREDAKTAKLDAEQKKLYEGRIAAGMQMLETGKAVWGNDPEIAKALDEQANRLRDPSIDPAIRAGMTDSIAKTLDMLATQGSNTAKREEAKAKAHAAKQQVIAFQRQAAQMGLDTGWLDDIETGAPDMVADPMAAATFWEGIANSTVNNSKVIGGLMAQQKGPQGYDSPEKAIEVALANNASSIQVFPRKDGGWDTNFTVRQGETTDGVKEVTFAGFEPFNIVYDQLSNGWVTEKNRIPYNNLFGQDPHTLARDLNPQMMRLVTKEAEGSTPKPPEIQYDASGRPVGVPAGQPFVKDDRGYNAVKGGVTYWYIDPATGQLMSRVKPKK
jgi:hypothetical protein